MDYRGEILFKFERAIISVKVDEENGKESKTFDLMGYLKDHIIPPKEVEYQIGDKIGQLIILKLPPIELQEVIEFSETTRGTGGFGSTGT